MNSDHLVLAITLMTSHSSVHIYVLIDSGASVSAFIDTDFAQLHKLKLYELKQPCSLTVVDRCLITSKAITHHVVSKMKISTHQKDLSMFMITLGHYSVVLSIKWL